MNGNSEWCLVATAEKSRVKRLQGRRSETHAMAAGWVGQAGCECLGRGWFQNSFRTLARCRHRQCLELLGEEGHRPSGGALLGMGRSTGSGHSGHSKAGKARRGPRVLQIGAGKEAQG